MTTQINLTELQKLIDANPHLLTQLQPLNKSEVITKPKMKRIKEGMTIEVEEPLQEVIKEITPAQARKLQKQMSGVEKRTRNITDEQKAVLLQNLEKGRERLRQVQEEKRKLKQEQSLVPKPPKEPEVLKFPTKTTDGEEKKVVVKKYIVKEKPRGQKAENGKKEPTTRKKFQKAPIESDEDDEESSGFDTDRVMSHINYDNTTSDSDAPIIRKIKKKVASIKKADKIIKSRQVPAQQPFVINPFYS